MPSKQKQNKRRNIQKHKTPYQRSCQLVTPNQDQNEEQKAEHGRPKVRRKTSRQQQVKNVPKSQGQKTTAPQENLPEPWDAAVASLEKETAAELQRVQTESLQEVWQDGEAAASSQEGDRPESPAGLQEDNTAASLEDSTTAKLQVAEAASQERERVPQEVKIDVGSAEHETVAALQNHKPFASAQEGMAIISQEDGEGSPKDLVPQEESHLDDETPEGQGGDTTITARQQDEVANDGTEWMEESAAGVQEDENTAASLQDSATARLQVVEAAYQEQERAPVEINTDVQSFEDEAIAAPEEHESFASPQEEDVTLAPLVDHTHVVFLGDEVTVGLQEIQTELVTKEEALQDDGPCASEEDEIHEGSAEDPPMTERQQDEVANDKEWMEDNKTASTLPVVETAFQEQEGVPQEVRYHESETATAPQDHEIFASPREEDTARALEDDATAFHGHMIKQEPHEHESTAASPEDETATSVYEDATFAGLEEDRTTAAHDADETTAALQLLDEGALADTPHTADDEMRFAHPPGDVRQARLASLNMKKVMMKAWLHLGKMKLRHQASKLMPPGCYLVDDATTTLELEDDESQEEETLENIDMFFQEDDNAITLEMEEIVASVLKEATSAALAIIEANAMTQEEAMFAGPQEEDATLGSHEAEERAAPLEDGTGAAPREHATIGAEETSSSSREQFERGEPGEAPTGPQEEETPAAHSQDETALEKEDKRAATLVDWTPHAALAGGATTQHKPEEPASACRDEETQQDATSVGLQEEGTGPATQVEQIITNQKGGMTSGHEIDAEIDVASQEEQAHGTPQGDDTSASLQPNAGKDTSAATQEDHTTEAAPEEERTSESLTRVVLQEDGKPVEAQEVNNVILEDENTAAPQGEETNMAPRENETEAAHQDPDAPQDDMTVSLAEEHTNAAPQQDHVQHQDKETASEYGKETNVEPEENETLMPPQEEEGATAFLLDVKTHPAPHKITPAYEEQGSSSVAKEDETTIQSRGDETPTPSLQNKTNVEPGEDDVNTDPQADVTSMPTVRNETNIEPQDVAELREDASITPALPDQTNIEPLGDDTAAAPQEIEPTAPALQNELHVEEPREVGTMAATQKDETPVDPQENQTTTAPQEHETAISALLNDVEPHNGENVTVPEKEETMSEPQENPTPAPALQNDTNVEPQEGETFASHQEDETSAMQNETNVDPRQDDETNVQPVEHETASSSLQNEMNIEPQVDMTWAIPQEDDTPTSALQNQTNVERQTHAARQEDLITAQPQEDEHPASQNETAVEPQAHVRPSSQDETNVNPRDDERPSSSQNETNDSRQKDEDAMDEFAKAIKSLLLTGEQLEQLLGHWKAEIDNILLSRASPQ